jgi:hypothetical protein
LLLRGQTPNSAIFLCQESRRLSIINTLLVVTVARESVGRLAVVNAERISVSMLIIKRDGKQTRAYNNFC